MKRWGSLDQIGFRGDRDYLHGTDLFNQVAARLPLAAPLSVRFHRAMVRVPELFELAHTEPTLGWPALFLMGSGPETRTIGLRETATAPAHRFAYDESEVVASASIDRETAAIASPPDSRFTFIERTVALQKKLLNEVLSADVRWLFTRLDLATIPQSEAGHLSLNVTQSLGVRIVKSQIREDHEVLGDIYFSAEKA